MALALLRLHGTPIPSDPSKHSQFSDGGVEGLFAVPVGFEVRERNRCWHSSLAIRSTQAARCPLNRASPTDPQAA